MKRVALVLIVLAASLAFAQNTYYISSSLGNDSNNGLCKGQAGVAPCTGNDANGNPNGAWANAPGMNGLTVGSMPYKYNARLNVIPAANYGDRFVFRGCDVWTNAKLVWVIRDNTSGSGPGFVEPTSSTQAYNFNGDYDKTWYNATNCPNGWDRPILDGCVVSAAPSGNLPGCTGANIALTADNAGVGGTGAIIYRLIQYANITGFEIRNQYGAGSPNAIVASQGKAGTVDNVYIHARIPDPYTVTTGTIPNGSNVATLSSITRNDGTNIVAGMAANCDTCGWSSVANYITAVNVGAKQITLTSSVGNASCASTPCNWLIGSDDEGAAVQGSGITLTNSVIDYLDTKPVQDGCGATVGSCVTQSSGTNSIAVARNNVIRYVTNGYRAGAPAEFSGNKVEHVRNSTAPAAHTNLFQSTGDTGVLLYNNVFVNTDVVGQSVQWCPQTGSTAYIFGNVFTNNNYSNIAFEPCGANIQAASGTFNEFNNSAEAGPNSGPNQMGTDCPSSYTRCNIKNEFFYTSQTSPAISTCGANCTQSNNKVVSALTNFSAATATYAMQPSNSSASTLAFGADLTSVCNAIPDARAKNACLNSTTYGMKYTTGSCIAGGTHCAESSGVATASRPSGAWDAGAYQLSYVLTVSGSGNGTVTSDVGGINCTITNGVASGTCSASFINGASVTLTESPGVSYAFVGWSGGPPSCSGAGSTCALTMTQTIGMAASFNLNTNPGIIFSCSPLSVLPNSQTTCSWTVTGSPTSCALSDSGGGLYLISGFNTCASGTISTPLTVPHSTLTFTLLETNNSGTSTAQSTVGVTGSPAKMPSATPR